MHKNNTPIKESRPCDCSIGCTTQIYGVNLHLYQAMYAASTKYFTQPPPPTPPPPTHTIPAILADDIFKLHFLE